MLTRSTNLRLVIPTSENDDMEKVKKGDQPRRTIVLPEKLWQRLDDDAARCFRSANGHLEAILSAIYMNADTALHGIERGKEQTGNPRQAKVG